MPDMVVAVPLAVVPVMEYAVKLIEPLLLLILPTTTVSVPRVTEKGVLFGMESLTASGIPMEPAAKDPLSRPNLGGRNATPFQVRVGYALGNPSFLAILKVVEPADALSVRVVEMLAVPLLPDTSHGWLRVVCASTVALVGLEGLLPIIDGDAR
jgi:hypothetical protein